MSNAQDSIIDELKAIRADIKANQYPSPFREPRDVRAHVIGVLMQVRPMISANAAIDEARRICEYIETGNVSTGPVLTLTPNDPA